MEPFVTHTGIVAAIDRPNIDTDAIMPKQFLKRIERSGFGQFLFYEWRFDPQGKPIDQFILNREPYTKATILLTRGNFGCGSSREHAPWGLGDFGFRVLIAPSFADIFYNNCFKNGMLPIVLADEQVDELFRRTQATVGYRLTVDLEACRITDDAGLSLTFTVPPFQRQVLLEGLDEIGMTLRHADKIDAYEASHR